MLTRYCVYTSFTSWCRLCKPDSKSMWKMLTRYCVYIVHIALSTISKLQCQLDIIEDSSIFVYFQHSSFRDLSVLRTGNEYISFYHSVLLLFRIRQFISLVKSRSIFHFHISLCLKSVRRYLQLCRDVSFVYACGLLPCHIWHSFIYIKNLTSVCIYLLVSPLLFPSEPIWRKPIPF